MHSVTGHSGIAEVIMIMSTGINYAMFFLNFV